jgi:hypothetical protein
MATEDRDDSYTATVCAAVVGAIFTVGAFFVGGGRTALSVAVGALIAVANLLFLRAIVRALVQAPEEPEKKDGEEPGPDPDHQREGRRGGAAWGVFAILKIFLLFGGIFVLLTKGVVDPIPLVVGYGALPLGIVASTAVGSLRPRRRR